MKLSLALDDRIIAATTDTRAGDVTVTLLPWFPDFPDPAYQAEIVDPNSPDPANPIFIANPVPMVPIPNKLTKEEHAAKWLQDFLDMLVVRQCKRDAEETGRAVLTKAKTDAAVAETAALDAALADVTAAKVTIN